MNRIKELRQLNKVSQGDLAKITGLTRQAISYYENDKREPKNETLQKLAEYFGVSVTYIKGETKTEMLTKIINTMYLIICNRIPMSSDRETIDNTENSRTIAATELMLLMYQVLNLDHNKQFEEIVGKNANLLGIKGKAKLNYIRESSESATDDNYKSDIENAKAWIKFYENL
ncbi:helix-turn-helix domain-containing protein [Lactobacillus kimbladii]|uniref:helix-turn-helix domain-containing protein n=1 Tax=Lactobacillus kimbladii TaxID=1218506 RepID=UPI00164FF481|nr:helix-turn-helix transcriptional regulator [Lactobacillus kimbladii]